MAPEIIGAIIAAGVALVTSIASGIFSLYTARSKKFLDEATASEKIAEAAQGLLAPLERKIEHMGTEISLLDIRHSRDEMRIRRLTRLLFIAVEYVDDLRNMLIEAGITPPPQPAEISLWLEQVEDEFSDENYNDDEG